ncbi:MAG: phytoene desaturase family protein [Anaerolineae bacterium]
MGTNSYDVVVIGAGIAGLGTAAMLAKDFGKRVLVVERAPFIGGRAVSFVGNGNKVTVDGLELDADGLRKALGHARTFISNTYPDLDTIFEQGLLDGYTFEAGGHGLFWGNKGRIEFLLQHLGEFVDIPVNTGFAFVDWEGGNKKYQVEPLRPYPWMSEEAYEGTRNALRDMAIATFEDMARLMDVSLEEWLRDKNLNDEAYDFVKVLISSQSAMAEPAMAPVGDVLGYMAIARPIKMNIITGSVGTVPEPGTIAIPQAMEKVLLAHAGEVRRSTTVKEVLIEAGKSRGVVISTPDGGQETVRADAVICTIPPKYIFSVLPRQPFPADWVDVLENRFWGAGLLSAYIGLKRNVWEQYGIDERSFVYMPGAIRNEGFIGDVDIVMWGMGAVADRAPEGKRTFEFSVALTDNEQRDPQRVKRVTDWCDNYFRETFPTWEEDMEFCIWTPSPEAYGLWRPVGEGVERPDVKSPWVEGLYFAGDQYGRRLWGGGIDGAAISAVMCVDSMMGANYEEEIFPWYHRGIPDRP